MEIRYGLEQRNICRENKLKNCQSAIQKVWNFLEKYLALSNSHGAEFLSHNQWDTYVPCDVQEQLLEMSRDDLIALPLLILNSQADLKDALYSSNSWLYSYISQAYMCHLENLNILSPLTEAVDQVRCDGSRAEAMSEKKGHEVNIMSQVVTAVCDSTKADMVVDIGSGKGYLGAELTRRHNITVLGLDASDTNTHGAKKREDLLSKKFKNTKQKIDKISSEENIEDKKQTYRKVKKEQNIEPLKTGFDGTDVILLEPKKYIPVTMYVHPDMGLTNIIGQFTQLFHSQKETHLVLTGLHTCGSLAVTLMKLFLQDPGAVAVVSVGCCYQQMEEAECSVQDVREIHFPISQLGRKLKLYLGRNARNLASQSLHRIQASKQLQGKDFYWRALLDVVIKKLGLPVPDRIKGVRGLNKKCQNFKEYAMKALQGLGVPQIMVPEDLLETTEKLYEDTENKMAALFQLKLVLAPVIESLILLDRLMFLLEQETVESTHLVQLFDPLTSPRCYSVISFKDLKK